MNQSLGERRVRIKFNPSNDDLVYQIKEKTAELINLVDSLTHADGGGEFGRLKSLAMTEYEGACHWAVKAATS